MSAAADGWEPGSTRAVSSAALLGRLALRMKKAREPAWAMSPGCSHCLTLTSLCGSVLAASVQFLFYTLNAMSSCCIISRNLDPVYIYNNSQEINRNKRSSELGFPYSLCSYTTFSHGDGRCSSWPHAFAGGSIQRYSHPTLPNSSLGISGCVMHITAKAGWISRFCSRFCKVPASWETHNFA